MFVVLELVAAAGRFESAKFYLLGTVKKMLSKLFTRVDYGDI